MNELFSHPVTVEPVAPTEDRPSTPVEHPVFSDRSTSADGQSPQT